MKHAKRHTDVDPPIRGGTASWGSVRHYREEGGLQVIDVSAGSVAQLFSGLDPAPFRHKDLDPEVEAYILAAAREVGGPRTAKLAIHLPANAAASADGQGLPDAVHNFFGYREWVTTEDLKHLLRIGVISLIIGLSFLFICQMIRQLLANGETSIPLIGEGLLIVGWVALWRPLEIALYDWWPLWRRVRLYRALKAMPVEIRIANSSP